MALSLFDDKSKQPTKQMLAKTLGKQYQLWADIANIKMLVDIKIAS